MRKGSKIISTLLLGTTLGSVGTSVFAVESKDVISEKLLAGATRYESAIEVSKEGWKISDTAVLVNGTALSDALAATPYAKMKNAPILLTEMDKLSQSTKKELERLKVKNVSIVGGEGVVSKNVVNELQAMGIKTFRIFGKDRFETSLQVAEKLDAKAVAVVNGLDGRLADAMSIASPAAKKGMAVLLSDGKSLRGADKFVKDNKISETYVIGGNAVVSDENANSIKALRIGGQDRRETNGEVLKKFYDEKELKNIYVAKDGASKESELVDALSAGSLAAKEGAPVMLLGTEVSKVQKEFLKEKQIKALTQVGFGINEKSLKELYEVLNVTKGIEVSTVKELESAVENSKDRELIKFTPKADVKENYEIKSNKEIVIELNGNFSGEIKIDMPKGDVINQGELKGKVNLNEIKSGTLLNNGTIHNIEVNDKTGSSIVNGKNGVVNKLTIGEKVKTYISGNVKEIVVEGKKSEVKLGGEINSVKVNGEEASVKIEKKSKIKNVEITGSAKGTKISNDGSVTALKVSSNANDVKIDVTNGKVEKLEGNKDQVIGGDKNIGTITKPSTGGGASSGGGSTSTKPEIPEIPQESKLDEAKKNAKNDLNKELEKYKQEDYTVDNFNNINKIKTNADAMINEAKTEEEVNAIKVNASNAMNAVKTILFEVKEAFVLKVSEVNSKNLIEDNYTVESFGALQNALNFDVTGKTVAEINEAVVAIEKALEELKVSDLKIAKDVVGKAENTMKYEDVEAAKTLIGKLLSGDTKDKLFERMYKAITIKNELGTTTIQFPYELREFNMTVKSGQEEKTVKMVVDGLKHELEVEGLKACESDKGFEYKDYKNGNNNVVFTAYVENASRIRFVDNENSDEIVKITYKTIKESEKEIKEAVEILNEKVSEVENKNLLEEDYTVESFGALQNALNFNIEGKTVAEINEAIVAIEKALEELKVSDLKIAKDAVEKAESTMKYEDVEVAKILIGKLPNGEVKDKLFERMYKAITIKNELGTTTIQFPYELREFNMTVKNGQEEKTVKIIVDGLKHELEVEGLKACESEKGFEYKDYKDENNNVVFTAYVENGSRIRFVDNENSDEIMKITYKTEKDAKVEDKKELDNALEAIKNNSIKLSFEEFNKKENRIEKTKEYIDNLVENKNIKISITKCDKDDFYKVSLKLNKESVNKTIEVKYTTSPQVVSIKAKKTKISSIGDIFDNWVNTKYSSVEIELNENVEINKNEDLKSLFAINNGEKSAQIESINLYENIITIKLKKAIKNIDKVKVSYKGEEIGAIKNKDGNPLENFEEKISK